MKVTMFDEEDLEVSAFLEPEFDIELEDPEAHFSALQMFATSFALCTFAILAEYAQTIDADASRIAIRLRWSYAEHPRRIDDIAMDVAWPGLPESRAEAAQRVASMCTLHNTLHRPPRVETRLDSEGKG